MLFCKGDRGLLASAVLIACVAQGCGSDGDDDHQTGGGGAGGGGAGGGELPHAGRGGLSGGGTGGGIGGSGGEFSGGAAGAPGGDGPGVAGAAGTGGNAGSGGIDESLGGTAGTPDESAGSGGSASAELAVSTDSLVFFVVCPGPAVVPSKTFTVSNPGGATLTWSATSAASWFTIAPASGTLAAGAHADVTISPKKWDPPQFPPGITELTGDITVTSDELGASAGVHVLESNGGYSASVVVPANIDFGLVPVPGLATVTIQATNSTIGPVLNNSNTTDFHLSGIVTDLNGRWTLQFTPSTVGPHTTTLTLGSMTKCVLSPNTFTATGTGIVN